MREQHRTAITDHLGRAAGNGHRILESLYERPIEPSTASELPVHQQHADTDTASTSSVPGATDMAAILSP